MFIGLGSLTLVSGHLHYLNWWGGLVFAPFAIFIGLLAIAASFPPFRAEQNSQTATTLSLGNKLESDGIGKMPKIGRNSLCHCGSGLKYKHCCLSKDEVQELEENERAERRNENVIGGGSTIFSHAIKRAYDTARQIRRAQKRPARNR